MDKMRCDEVIRELAVPTDDRDRTALAEHLAGCPSCAAWSRRAAMLDRLWDATRPAEPSPEAWDAVWANINRSLESPAAGRELAATAPASSHPATPVKVFAHPGNVPTQPANRPRMRRFVAIGLMVGLAQAAAILIAVGLAWHDRPETPTPQNLQIAQNPTPTAPHLPRAIRVSEPVIVADFDIEEGHSQVIMIRVDGSAPGLVDVTAPETPYGGIVNKTPGYVEMFNAVESFAKTVVASQ
jgi:hypothetical protein